MTLTVENKIRIVIVEDSAVLSLELQTRLGEEGFLVVGAYNNGEDAIREIKAVNPQLVLMDIKLKGPVNGIETAALIKERFEIPVVFTTAYYDDSTIELVKSSDSDGYIIKPYNYKELFTIIELTIKKYQLQKDIKISEKRYHKLFENSRDPIFIMNGQGNLIDANKTFLKMFKFGLNDLQGFNLENLFTDKKEFAEAITELIRTGSIEDFEAVLKTKNGAELVCLTSASKIEYNTMQTEEYQGIIRDITHHKLTEKELFMSNLRLEKAIYGIVTVTANTLEMRDPYTAGHQRRVALIAKAIAEEMSLEVREIEGIQLAGEIHDIGKISIPAELLSKPNRLTDNEFSLIKSHAQVGYLLLKEIEFPWPLADIIYQHHERINGSGYPLGLEGDNIVLEAKILTVADVVEAMGSHRPYRPAIGLDKAISEINDNSENLYDGDVVTAFNRAIETKRITSDIFLRL